MKSTRSRLSTTASKAILKGLADDGGLYVFETFDASFYNAHFLDLSYQQTARLVMRLFLDDFRDEDIDEVIYKSYDQKHFPDEIVSLTYHKQHAYLNLYHGATLAFKDLALSTLPYLYQKAKQIQGDLRETIILTATSGDTGSAALAGFSQTEDVATMVLYPAKGVSAFQALQMKHMVSEKATLWPIKGNFDDCQTIVKQLFADIKPNKVLLSSANSINIGRIIPQVVYYVYAYGQLVKNKQIAFGELVDVIVPTGNFGNIYAAYVAKRLGVPYGQLVIASNENDVLTKLFNDGVYDTNRSLKKTMSPSMDILISSNVERYLYHLLDSSKRDVRALMTKLKSEGFVQIDALKSQTDFLAYMATEQETMQTIKATYERDGVLIDPHTAVATCCSEKFQMEKPSSHYQLIVSTASPLKFSETIMKVFNVPNQGSLRENIALIKKRFGVLSKQPLDEILNTNMDIPSLGLDQAYKAIKKWIGDRND